MKKKALLGSRAFWLRQMRQWHWISAAMCLVGMLLFAITGITLNHASQIEAKPQIERRAGQLPADLLPALKAEADRKGPLQATVARWLNDTMGIDVASREPERSAQEIYIPLPRPGGDAWISLDAETGEARYEKTDRGWISYLNDLHKGRNIGAMWSGFLDIFAVACVVFCATGLALLQLMAGQRPSTWPLVGLGLVIPALLALLFIH